MEWDRHKGPTETAETGPSADHTTGSGKLSDIRLMQFRFT